MHSFVILYLRKQLFQLIKIDRLPRYWNFIKNEANKLKDSKLILINKKNFAQFINRKKHKKFIFNH